jgi:hypothetical protein
VKKSNLIKTFFSCERKGGFKIRYTFQDSTDFPVQRDFIQDLQDFLITSKEVIPLEKSTIEIKIKNKEKTVIFEKSLQKIERFEKDVRDYIESRIVGVEEDDILETVSNLVLAKKNEKIEALDRQNKLDLMEVQQLETRILSILNPFFESSIYGAKSTYHASIEDKRLRGKQVSFVEGIQYEFELDFTRDTLKVKDLYALTLPVWSKSGILSREKK